MTFQFAQHTARQRDKGVETNKQWRRNDHESILYSVYLQYTKSNWQTYRRFECKTFVITRNISIHTLSVLLLYTEISTRLNNTIAERVYLIFVSILMEIIMEYASNTKISAEKKFHGMKITCDFNLFMKIE